MWLISNTKYVFGKNYDQIALNGTINVGISCLYVDKCITWFS
jgi:hypothetical protein